ncbi:hypothetical protein C8J57DRAFT_1439208 [Mycena rebaudengoi]|nr:hypothetical protein C8J57DRAFT_1439208 [Mycena rebaudengoi]
MSLRQCRCECLPECQLSSRCLVVSIDGTSNQFGPRSTNVVELHSRIVKNVTSAPQLTLYLSGIGTYVPHSAKRLRQAIASRLDQGVSSLIYFRHFEVQIHEAYRWLADEYRPGDRIFLFGFSRGAYQVRVLAGMISKMGLIHKGNHHQIPFAFELYARHSETLCENFRTKLSRPDVKVHFVGVWDTVSSVGTLRGQPLPLTASAGHICHFRHALALDERRVKFLPEYIHSEIEDPDHSIQCSSKEVWFAGSHSDM